MKCAYVARYIHTIIMNWKENGVSRAPTYILFSSNVVLICLHVVFVALFFILFSGAVAATVASPLCFLGTILQFIFSYIYVFDCFVSGCTRDQVCAYRCVCACHSIDTYMRIRIHARTHVRTHQKHSLPFFSHQQKKQVKEREMRLCL